MKQPCLLPTLSLGLNMAAERFGNFFWRLALLLTVISVLMFVSIGTASAHIDTLVPNQWTTGGPGFNLRILGRDFDQSDTGRVKFNNTRVPATLISAQELQAMIPASLIGSPATVVVELEGFNSVGFIINPPPTITTPSTLPDGLLGFPYMQTLMRAGGSPPFIWSWTSGGIPLGMSFSEAGILSGTPDFRATTQTFNFTFVLKDAAGVTATKDFSLTIRAPGLCVDTIFPEFSVPDSFGDFRSFVVAAPDDCLWSASATAFPWIKVLTSSGQGSGRVEFEVLPNDSDSQRRGWVFVTGLVNSRHHWVHQNSNPCPARFVCKLFPTGCTESGLSLSRRFRDEALAKTPRGQKYTRLYYEFSKEAVQIMLLNPMLILRSRATLEQYKPVIESMVRGEPVSLTQGDIEEIDSFLNAFAVKGSAQLQESIKSLCEDLRDSQVHREFNITIIDGPKRDAPVRDSVQSIKQTAMLVVPLGLLFLFHNRARTRRKNQNRY